MNEKSFDFIFIIILFAVMVVGTILYTNKMQDISNHKITIISDSEMDK